MYIYMHIYIHIYICVFLYLKDKLVLHPLNAQHSCMCVCEYIVV